MKPTVCSHEQCLLPARGRVVVLTRDRGRLIVLWGAAPHTLTLPAELVTENGPPVCRWHLLEATESHLRTCV